MKTKSEDVVTKIPIPKMGNEIDMGFARLNYKSNGQGEEDNDKDSEDSDTMADDSRGVLYLQYDAVIENVFHSRCCAAVSYLAIVGDLRFTIYCLYDNDGAAGKDCLWDFNYRFDKHIVKYGK